eukprot:6186184-Pleurochrysis_carterae.AAC.1
MSTRSTVCQLHGSRQPHAVMNARNRPPTHALVRAPPALACQRATVTFSRALARALAPAHPVVRFPLVCSLRPLGLAIACDRRSFVAAGVVVGDAFWRVGLHVRRAAAPPQLRAAAR